MYSFSQSFQLADDVTVQTGILAIRHDSTAEKTYASTQLMEINTTWLFVDIL